MRVCKGQAFLESTIFIVIVGVVIVLSFGEFSFRFNEWRNADQQANIILEQAWLRNALNMDALPNDILSESYGFHKSDTVDYYIEANDGYPASNSLSNVLSSLSGEATLFPVNNQYHLQVVNNDTNWFSYRKLDDNWSAKSHGDLSNAPRQFVTSHHISKLPIETIQQWVAILPFAREFGPQSFKLGWVDPDVVPEIEPEGN